MWDLRELHRVYGLTACLLLAAPLVHAHKKPQPAKRWAANVPGCEFKRGEDGRYRWTMVADDLGITVMVDSQELTKTRHRLYHGLAVYLSATYTGQSKLEFPADVRMEFILHHNVIEAYDDPTELSTRLQNDVDTLVFDTEREMKKDPKKADEKTARAREYEKEVAEFIEFLSTQSLQPATLTPGDPEVHGWVFFGTKNKWIGPWKNPEHFILRVLLKDKVVWEFPLFMPPSEDDLILRKRDE